MSLSLGLDFLREFSDPVIKTDRCAHYVDDIGIAAQPPEQLITNLRGVFDCNQNDGLKLLMAKGHFGTKEIDYLGRIITSNGVTPQKQTFKFFLEEVKFPLSKKALFFIHRVRNSPPKLHTTFSRTIKLFLPTS